MLKSPNSADFISCLKYMVEPLGPLSLTLVFIQHVIQNISAFLDFHLKPIPVKVKSYIKDTITIFLENFKLPENIILCTTNLVGLYPNIPIVEQSIVNFISDIRIYNYKKTQFSVTEINIEIKTTAKAVIKNELKYFLMSEGNTCIAEPNLEVLPLI